MFEYLKRKPSPRDCCYPANPNRRFYEDKEYRERLEHIFTIHNEFHFPDAKVTPYDKSTIDYFTQKATVCNNSFEFSHYSIPISLNRKIGKTKVSFLAVTVTA